LAYSGPSPSTTTSRSIPSASLARSAQFEETERSRAKLADLAFAARVQVSSSAGRITLSGASRTDEMLAFVEVAYRTHPGEELRPRFD